MYCIKPVWEYECRIGVLKDTTINKEDPSSYNPIIPEGFYPVSNNNANWENLEWNNGLEIKSSSDGSIFVWVPIINFHDFKRYFFDSFNFNGFSKKSNLEDFLTKEMKQKLEAGIKKYGGIYIAKYPISSKENKIYLSKNNTPVDNITYAEFIELKKELNYVKVKTIIPTGKLFDSMLLWFKNTGHDVTNFKNNFWSEEKNHLILNNIVFYKDYSEFTSEQDNMSLIIRGDTSMFCNNRKCTNFLSSRTNISKYQSSKNLTARVALIIP